MKQFNGKGIYFEYIGDGRCENTLYPDIVYNDGGVIRYFDDVQTGYNYNSEVRVWKENPTHIEIKYNG